MEKMENRFFKLRISRIFRFSFRSCRSRNVSDVIEKVVFVPHQIPLSRHSPHQTPPPPSTQKPRPFRSICPNPTRTVNESCIISAGYAVRRSRTKAAEQRSPFSRVNASRFCPSSSPLSPAPFYERTEGMKKRNAAKKKKKKSRRKNHCRPLLRHDYDFYGGDWFSSDDEREEDHGDGEIDTLFSSRSTLSSDSSPKNRRSRSRRKNPWRVTAASEKGESFAVVKRSSDPYGDFRTSMVEMIVERQIFGAAELEKLLQCFLGLNSTHHHATILEVFKDICDTLFCNLS